MTFFFFSFFSQINRPEDLQQSKVLGFFKFILCGRCVAAVLCQAAVPCWMSVVERIDRSITKSQKTD